jgi:hypothetical protein
MKSLTKIILLKLIISCNLYSQSAFDLRKVNWGMSKEDVIKSEQPLQYEQKSNGDIVYSNITVDNLIIELVYSFKNGRLSDATYYISYKYQKVNCEDKLSLSGKRLNMNAFFKSLTDKKYKCVFNWAGDYYSGDDDVFPGSRKTKIINSIPCKNNWTLDEFDAIDSWATKSQIFNLYISLESERTYVKIEFNEFKNSLVKKNELLNLWKDCNFWFFKEIARIHYSPTHKVQTELNDGQF